MKQICGAVASLFLLLLLHPNQFLVVALNLFAVPNEHRCDEDNENRLCRAPEKFPVHGFVNSMITAVKEISNAMTEIIVPTNQLFCPLFSTSRIF